MSDTILQLNALLPDEVTIDTSLQFRNGNLAGKESYADVTIGGDGLLAGQFDAYCADIDTAIGVTETGLTARVVSIYEDLPSDIAATGRIETPENFDLVGWILNQCFVDKESSVLDSNVSGAFTFGDVQAAIWTLLGDPDYRPNGPDIRPINQDRVDLIVDLATANGENFVPDRNYTTIFGEEVTGQVGVLLFPDKNTTDANPFDKQPLIITVDMPDPGINVEKFVNGFDVVDPSNIGSLPEIAAGDDVTFTYAVSNTGTIGLGRDHITLVDDNGTADTSDDLSIQNGKIAYVAGDLNNNNVLDLNETWLYASETLEAENLTTVTESQDIRFHFTGYSYTDGPKGNVRTFMQDGVSVDVSAFSRSKWDGNWNKAYLGVYGGGLGVTNVDENGHLHRVDNSGSLDYVLFEFDQDVAVDKAFLDYVGHDSDITIWIGDRNGADISHLDDELLESFAQEHNFTRSSYSRWADFNDGSLVGDTVIISAYTKGSNDSFKLKKLDITVPGETEVGVYKNTVTAAFGDVSDSDMSGYTNPEPVEPPKHYLYEAEDMHLCGYRVEHVGDDIASGGEVIKLSAYDGYASFRFDGHSGEYDILVGYFDENDGHSMAKVKVGGDTVSTWTFDEHTDSAFASASNAREEVIEDVHILKGETIKLSGWFNHSEFARFDYVKIVESVDIAPDNLGSSASSSDPSGLANYLSENAPELLVMTEVQPLI
jgi:hypothetical protein